MIISRPRSYPNHCALITLPNFLLFSLKTQDARLVGFLSLTQIGPGLLVAGCDPAAALMTIVGNVLVKIFHTSRCPLALETLMNRGVSNRVKMVQIKT